jgi:hypothetical protein
VIAIALPLVIALGLSERKEAAPSRELPAERP